jgi:hypothetical protein
VLGAAVIHEQAAAALPQRTVKRAGHPTARQRAQADRLVDLLQSRLLFKQRYSVFDSGNVISDLVEASSNAD